MTSFIQLQPRVSASTSQPCNNSLFWIVACGGHFCSALTSNFCQVLQIQTAMWVLTWGEGPHSTWRDVVIKATFEKYTIYHSQSVLLSIPGSLSSPRQCGPLSERRAIKSRTNINFQRRSSSPTHLEKDPSIIGINKQVQVSDIQKPNEKPRFVT